MGVAEVVVDPSSLGAERRYVSLEEEAPPSTRPEQAPNHDGAPRKKARSFAPRTLRAVTDSASAQFEDEARASAGQVEMRDVFGPGGLLERSMIGGYEHRRAQLEMAEVVHDAFQTRHHVIVEAGTGTGKTLAYLLP